MDYFNMDYFNMDYSRVRCHGRLAMAPGLYKAMAAAREVTCGGHDFQNSRKTVCDVTCQP